MAFVVLYDANVLYPSTLRDLLIRIAQAGVVQAAKWTDQILDEVFGNLTANRPDLDPQMWPFTGERVRQSLELWHSQSPRLGWPGRPTSVGPT